MKLFTGFLLLLLIPFLGMAQRTKTIRGNQQWIHKYATLKVSERFNVVADGGFRLRDAFTEPSLYIVRAGGTFNVHPRWKIGAGFAHSGTFLPDSGLYKLEYRPYQEVISEHTFADVELTNRLRIEQRFQHVLPNDSTVPFVARVRFKFQVAAPVVSLSKKHPERKLFIILADEFLLNAGKGIKYNILDKNRMMIGSSFRISKHLDIALLYSYQFGTTTKPNVFTQDHVLWLTIKHKFDFRRNKEEKLPSSRTLEE